MKLQPVRYQAMSERYDVFKQASNTLTELNGK